MKRLFPRILLRKNAGERRGVATVEGAIALSILFFILFGLFDLGIAVLRLNMLSVAAHAVARAAVVRGSTTAADVTAWGTQSYSGNMGDGSGLAQSASVYLVTMTTSQVSLNVTWPDADNDVGDRIAVTLAYQHQPVTPILSSIIGTLNLQGKATLRIEE